jgi:hypothetical protein
MSARTVQRDAALREVLTKMVETISGDPNAGYRLAVKEQSEDLTRLVHAGDDIRKALSGQVPAELILDLEQLRNSLERRLLRAVLSDDEADTASPLLKRFFRMVRLARMGDGRLLNALDLPDCGSAEFPLAGFEQLSGDGRAEFSDAMMMMATVWGQAWPPHAAPSLRFCSRLARYVGRKRQEGVPWSALSTYYKHLMLKVDSSAKQFALRETRDTYRSCPDPRWVDGQFEYVRRLSEGTVQHRIDRAQAATLASVAAATAASDALEAANGNVSKAVALRAEQKRVAKRLKTQRKAANKKARLAGTAPPAPQPELLALTWDGSGPEAAAGSTSTAAKSVTFAAAKTGQKPQTQAELTREKIERSVAEKHPPIGGRKACAFFFGPKGRCSFDAADCPSGHHGA